MLLVCYHPTPFLFSFCTCSHFLLIFWGSNPSVFLKCNCLRTVWCLYVFSTSKALYAAWTSDSQICFTSSSLSLGTMYLSPYPSRLLHTQQLKLRLCEVEVSSFCCPSDCDFQGWSFLMSFPFYLV